MPPVEPMPNQQHGQIHRRLRPPDPDRARRAMAAMVWMVKIDIAALEAAVR
jgi:hypothetical protein